MKEIKSQDFFSPNAPLSLSFEFSGLCNFLCNNRYLHNHITLMNHEKIVLLLFTRGVMLKWTLKKHMGVILVFFHFLKFLQIRLNHL